MNINPSFFETIRVPEMDEADVLGKLMEKYDGFSYSEDTKELTIPLSVTPIQNSANNDRLDHEHAER